MCRVGRTHELGGDGGPYEHPPGNCETHSADSPAQRPKQEIERWSPPPETSTAKNEWVRVSSIDAMRIAPLKVDRSTRDRHRSSARSPLENPLLPTLCLEGRSRPNLGRRRSPGGARPAFAAGVLSATGAKSLDADSRQGRTREVQFGKSCRYHILNHDSSFKRYRMLDRVLCIYQEMLGAVFHKNLA
ncbi:hypothetical protein AXG93_3256s1610 [Marchantia polymorpha subsp. ruderalis]|uniref:Uncharacterized protein n=1 Tax=Marchantia polymorpha subsp. ruderalis TaxID=1480154 RepID=A0A176VJ26_MARPO|nr:hypothetical protein AXG93_3256s1610 [Marchantia polymorpha subsp. ruderalis]